jgi:hypothetical protein
MHLAHWAVGLVSSVLLLTPALAQTYRCGGDGAPLFYSDRPCYGTAPAKLAALGSVPTAQIFPRSATYSAPLPRAPDHLKFLSSECAALNDAVRTGPSRGVGRNVLADLQSEYQRKCSEDDQSARQQSAQEMNRNRDQERAARALAVNEKAQERMRSEQCDGMRDVIQTKRARLADLGPADLSALQAFESSYNSRCVRKR